MKSDINDKKIDEFLDRGIENIYPNRDFVYDKLKEGKCMDIYLGIDPTGPSLHLGHAIVLKKMRELQNLGHRVTVLIGDFTATIGDPTDKASVRKQLTRKEVLQNAKSYKKQAGTFLRFYSVNRARIRHNSKWFAKMTFEKVLHLASKMTVEQMLKRDMFDTRMKEGKPIYINEFLYPLMQGYDSVALDTDGEIGGNDQTFNMLAGRTLMKQLVDKEKFVISVKLLEDREGKKMGKTEGNMVALTDSPEEMFGKVMSWTDEMIISGFELCTYVSLDEISTLKRDLENMVVNPRDIKMRLAREIVSVYHGDKKADKAEQNFVNTFQNKKVPEEVSEVVVEKGTPLLDVLLKNGLVKSKTEFRRLVKDGAIKFEDGRKITDGSYKIIAGAVLKVGKRRFIKINTK